MALCLASPCYSFPNSIKRLQNLLLVVWQSGKGSFFCFLHACRNKDFSQPGHWRIQVLSLFHRIQCFDRSQKLSPLLPLPFQCDICDTQKCAFSQFTAVHISSQLDNSGNIRCMYMEQPCTCFINHRQITDGLHQLSIDADHFACVFAGFCCSSSIRDFGELLAAFRFFGDCGTPTVASLLPAGAANVRWMQWMKGHQSKKNEPDRSFKLCPSSNYVHLLRVRTFYSIYKRC